MTPITLQQIRDAHPCANGWAKLLASLGQNHAAPDLTMQISIGDVVLSSGLDDAHWYLRCLPPREGVGAVWPSVLRVQPDPLPGYVVDIQRWLDGDDTVDLKSAEAEAWAATKTTAADAWAARAALAAGQAARSAWRASAAARAARQAARAKGTAWRASAAARAAGATERDRQRNDLLRMHPPMVLKMEAAQ